MCNNATCVECQKPFERIGDTPKVEIRCVPCQVQFRIREAQAFKDSGEKPHFFNWWDKRNRLPEMW